MMKKGIVLHYKSLNYGDDIQSLAAYKLVGHPDYILDREKLNQSVTDDNIKLLCNGWFMKNPQNWPPSDNIIPLFISMHITHNNDSIKYLINKNLINYYKKFEPIGCRDYHTYNLFLRLGVKTYFSGCLTLTLQNEFNENDRTEEILFVDAFNKNLPADLRTKYFNQLVPQSIRSRVNFINHSHNNAEMSVKERLENAEKLVERYSKAHLVVTSRIHCALPCLALGTPVLFLDVGFNLKNSRNRFDGIIQNFNSLDNKFFPYSGIDLIGLFFRRSGLYNHYFPAKAIKYSWESPPRNPERFKQISEGIRRTINQFFSS